MKVIDLDSHSRPRPQDYIVEPVYWHLRPRSYVNSKGTIRHVFNNRILSVSTAGEQANANKKGHSNWRPANYDGEIRYRQVSEAGIDFQFVSAGTVASFNYIDASTGAAFCKASNDFIFNSFIKPYPKTFTGVPQLPLQDIPEALKELHRCINDLGMRTFLIPTNWNGIDMADPHWWSLYEGVRELGIRGIIVHFGTLHGPWVGKERLTVLGPEGTTGRRIVSGPFEYSTNIINLIFGGMMDVFPELRFAFLEVGARFAIDLKDRIEENLEQITYLRDMLAHPLQWYFERFYFLVDDRMLENDGKFLRYALDELGPDRLFLGSDYPHTDGHLETFNRLKELSWLSTDLKEKLLSANVEALMDSRLV
jgi:predicted TIM-barrel fold metal-dependent hydrolase